MIGVIEVYNCLGPRYFHHAHHMTFDSLFHLHSILFPHIMAVIEEWSEYKKVGGRAGGNYVLPPIQNRPISSSVQLI